MKTFTIEVTRYELRLINFAMVATYWLHKLHYTSTSGPDEENLTKRIKATLNDADSQERE